ncbi:acyl-CoA/acyl-ACP dehydrogenase [Mycolicibacterium pulveris]|uniref:Acyl-CoA dehydrogenase n=1 Tax=Mycolicibacterium pulveris TaxID=36813 RepID=A0A7I7UQK6_MYCPV|nr:acyl-CoA dehydrogenase family protein [Mycolicibacterium pulveris]MCV6983861.1 acyl-CoA/acyl-ACP dehydrogenase [Mycolicibacterium pulveris]BBY83745.1 acyl-CoA dehydrogenase [Mycolicibacterium pulveris]
MNPNTVLAGGVLHHSPADDHSELRRLALELGKRSADRRLGRPSRHQRFDEHLWQNLEDTGLTRLTSAGEPDAGPAELAVVLHALAYHACAVPIAETALLSCWLGDRAGVAMAESGPFTVALADAQRCGKRVRGTAVDVPWARTADQVVLVARTPEGPNIGVAEPDEVEVTERQNLAGEPRDLIGFDLPVDRFRRVDTSLVTELLRRGAWARCVQSVGALDAAAELTLDHTRERIQFGRSLSAFQAVQQSLAQMAGEVERARASVALAVAAAADYGFGAAQTDYAVTVAKVVLGRVVRSATALAHQLHGAVGTTLEHRLWLVTMRAQSWIAEFGSPGRHARRLGRMVLAADNPWDFMVGASIGPTP